MDNHDEQFMSSLDACDHGIIEFIPYLLQDLWELGSRPSLMLEMIEKHIENPVKMQVLDLCCGKGAVLVQMAARFGCTGVGVDLLPDFIAEANEKAKKQSVAEKLQFMLEDIVESVEKYHDKDLVVFGYDTEVLGDIGESLVKIQPCLKPGGFVLLETVFAVDEELQSEGVVSRELLIQEIEQTGAVIIDSCEWTQEDMRQLNSENTAKIRKRTEELIEKYPDHQELFEEYIENQEAESAMLEEEMRGITLLLKLEE